MEQIIEFFKTNGWLLGTASAVISAVYYYLTNKSQKRFEAQLEKDKAQFQADITKQLKAKEVEFEKDLTEFKDELQKRGSQTAELRESLKTIYGSLMTVLLQVQNLNVKLSAICADESCLAEEIDNFTQQTKGVQEVLSKNSTFLPPDITAHIFSFFQYTSFLIIDLQKIRKAGCDHFKYAHACTYVFSRPLASQLIEMQSEIFKTIGQEGLDVNIHSKVLSSMIHCCGSEPEPDFLEEFCSIYKEPIGLKSDYTDAYDNELQLPALSPVNERPVAVFAPVGVNRPSSVEMLEDVIKKN